MPAIPLGLKGDPFAFAALPGVPGFSGPHVLFGAPFWPVVGFTRADPVVIVRSKIAIAKTLPNARVRSFLTISTLPKRFGDTWSPHEALPALVTASQRGRR